MNSPSTPQSPVRVGTAGRPLPWDGPPPASFAERLKLLRRAARLSQTDLAGEDLSPSYISLLEAGKRTPSTEVATSLAERLGCSVTMLLDGEPSERERRLELELSYSRLAMNHGEAGDAVDRLRLLLREPSLDPLVRDEAELLLAQALVRTGEPSGAAEVIGPLFTRARRGESHIPVSTVAVALCFAYMSLGDFHRVVLAGEQALDAAVDQGLVGTDEYFRLAATVMWAYHEVGDLAHASSRAHALIEEAKQSESVSGQAAIYWNASLIAQSAGRLEEALYLSNQAMARLEEQGSSRDLARLRTAAADVILSADPSRAGEAVQLIETAAQSLADFGSPQDLGETDLTLATAWLFQGDLPRAREAVESAARRLADSDAAHLSTVSMVLGDVLVAEGDGESALTAYRSAARHLAGTTDSGRFVARTWREIGDRLATSGASDDALLAYQRALDALSLASRLAPVQEAIAKVRARAADVTQPSA